MRRGTVALLATVIATAPVSACSGSDGPNEASGRPTTASSAAAASDAADRDAGQGSPADVLADALEELAALDTGRYRHVITIRDSVSSVVVEDLEDNPVSKVGLRLTGGYWLSARSATMTAVAFDKEHEQVQVRERIDGGRVFMQLPGWPKPVRRCWVTLNDDTVDGLLSQTGDSGSPLPMALAALDDVRAVDLDGQVLSATVPVGAALATACSTRAASPSVGRSASSATPRPRSP